MTRLSRSVHTMSIVRVSSDSTAHHLVSWSSGEDGGGDAHQEWPSPPLGGDDGGLGLPRQRPRPRPPLLHFTHSAAYGSAWSRSLGIVVPHVSHLP